MKVHTFNSLKNEGITITEMRKMAAQDWQEFRNEVANEEGTKPVKVTAKTVRHHDFAAFGILEDGKLGEIVYAVVEQEDGEFTVELAHHIYPNWQ